MKKILKEIPNPQLFVDYLQDATGLYGSGERMRIVARAGSEEERRKRDKFVSETIQAFLGYSDTPKSEAVQAFTTTGDIKQPMSSVFDMFMDIANYDDGWMALFKDSSSRITPGTDNWEVLTGQQGSAWEVIPEGKGLKVRKFTANDLQVCKVHKWGDAIGITDEMIRFRKVGPIMDIMQDFRDGYGRAKANAAYAALTTASAANVTTPDTTGSTVLEKDINTINTAVQARLTALKDTRNLPATTPVFMVIPDAGTLARSRILRALGELSQAFQTSTIRVSYNVIPIFTYNANLPAAATGEAFRGLIVVPGLKNQQGSAADLISLSDTDRLSLTYIQSQFAYWGLYVLDSAQVGRIGFAAS